MELNIPTLGLLDYDYVPPPLGRIAKSSGRFHKYVSKKPDGKGGWVYYYRREDGSLYSSGEKPKRDLKQWAITIRGAKSRLNAAMKKHPEGGSQKHKEKMARLLYEEKHVKELRRQGHTHAEDLHHDAHLSGGETAPPKKPKAMPEKPKPTAEKPKNSEPSALAKEVIDEYEKTRKMADELRRHDLLQGTIATKLPNILGTITRIPGTAYHRPGPKNADGSTRDEPLSEGQLQDIAAELRGFQRMMESRRKKFGLDKPDRPTHLWYGVDSRSGDFREAFHSEEEARAAGYKEVQRAPVARDTDIQYADLNRQLHEKKKNWIPQGDEKQEFGPVLSPLITMLEGYQKNYPDGGPKNEQDVADALRMKLNQGIEIYGRPSPEKTRKLAALLQKKGPKWTREAVRMLHEKAAHHEKRQKEDAEAKERHRKYLDNEPIHKLIASGEDYGIDRAQKLTREALDRAKAEKDTARRALQLSGAADKIKEARAAAGKLYRQGQQSGNYNAKYVHRAKAHMDALDRMHKQLTAEYEKAARANRAKLTRASNEAKKKQAEEYRKKYADHPQGTIKDGKMHLAGREKDLDQIADVHHQAGDWASHKDSDGKYSVSHVPTGLKARGGMTASDAKRYAKHMHENLKGGVLKDVGFGLRSGSQPSSEDQKKMREANESFQKKSTPTSEAAAAFKPVAHVDLPEHIARQLKPGTVHQDQHGTIVGRYNGRGGGWMRFQKKLNGTDYYSGIGFKTKGGAMRGTSYGKSQSTDPFEALEKSAFDVLANKLAHRKGVSNPRALAAAIGRKKYGEKGMEEKAAAGRHKKKRTKKSEEPMTIETEMLESTPHLRDQMKQLIAAQDPMAKGLYKFEPGYNKKLDTIPDEYLVAYLDAFIEEAYEHESRERTHDENNAIVGISQPGANGGVAGDEADYWAQWVMHELVTYIGKNQNLKRACQKVNCTSDYIADRLRAMGLVKPSLAGGVSMGDFMEGYQFSEEQTSAGIGKSFGVTVAEDEMFKSIARGQRVLNQRDMVPVQDDSIDPVTALGNMHRARFARMEAVYDLDLGYGTKKD